jgi:hypothetical protein
MVRRWQIRYRHRTIPPSLDLACNGIARRQEARPKPRSVFFPRSAVDGLNDICPDPAFRASGGDASLQRTRGSVAALQGV